MPEAEIRLDPTVELIEACHAPVAEAWSELEAHLAASVFGVLRDAVGRHGEAITSLGLESDAPAEASVRAERLRGYRHTVEAKMLEPLTEALDRFRPAASIEAALSTAIEQGRDRCLALDAEAMALWPEGGLTPRPSDGPRRRLGKVLARGFSAARKSGEPRSIPLRALAQSHLAQVVVPGQDEAAVLVIHEWATWAQKLELAWLEWGDVALPSLVSAEAPEEAQGQPGAAWVAIRDAAQALQARLETAIAEEPSGGATASARAALAEARDVLDADLAVAGSFLLRPRETEPAPKLARLEKATPAFEEWDDGLRGRLHLYRSLLSIMSGATAVQTRLVWRFHEKCLSKIADLPNTAAALDELRAQLPRGASRQALEGRLGSLPGSVTQTLEPAGRAIPAPAFVATAVRDVSDSTVEALLAVVRQAPTHVRLHAPEAKPPTGAGKAETRLLELQELARQSFDALRIERIRSSTAGLVNAIDETRADIAGLPEVFSFAHDQAMQELAEEGEESSTRALDLVSGALKSMAESLRTEVAELDAAVDEAQGKLATEITEGSLALLDRVGAGRMQAQLLAARSRVTDLFAHVVERATPPARRAFRRITVWWGHARDLALRLFRKGSAMVGGSAAEAADSTRALRGFTDMEAVTERLPLVYQRLFTLAPLSEPALLVGRSSDLDSAMRRWDSWHSDEGVPLIVRGRQGSGITSFLNAFVTRIEERGGKVVQISLTSRITDESQLAKALAEPLGLPVGSGLDELASAIFEAGHDALPGAVSLDNLEHVYLRVPGGTDLLERLLTLMAETEPHLFWIAGVTSSAWQLVMRTEPTAVSQVDVFELKPIDAEAFHEAVLARHRRSGLDVRYEEPTAGRHLLRTRLRRLTDKRRHEEQVEEDFFDQLYRTCDGYLGLGLYQWLVSADFGSENGVTMRYPQKPDFSVLDVLDLTQNFTLKAFLEHRTLTLAEHDRIFRLPRHESYQILESLRNRHLIEAVPAKGGDVERSEIEGDLRYRVRPLLTGAVISHLRGRNIVH